MAVLDVQEIVDLILLVIVSDVESFKDRVDMPAVIHRGVELENQLRSVPQLDIPGDLRPESSLRTIEALENLGIHLLMILIRKTYR